MRIIVLTESEEAASAKRVHSPSPTSAPHVAETLKALGHDASTLAFEPDRRKALRELAESQPGLVFNLVRCLRRNPRGGAAVAGLLEMLRLPFTGTGGPGVLVCLDQAISKQIVRDICVETPAFLEVPIGRKLQADEFAFPAIVKPRFSYPSEMASPPALLSTEHEAAIHVKRVHRRLKQPAVCEEFVGGRDISVGMLGNERPVVFPAAERILDHPRRESGGWPGRWRRADVSPALQFKLARLSRAIQRKLELRDYCRINYRLTPGKRILFLSAEAQPDLTPSSFGMMSSWASIDFQHLLKRICSLAVRRGAL
jgi:D-alanine-D-alanine ligase